MKKQVSEKVYMIDTRDGLRFVSAKNAISARREMESRGIAVDQIQVILIEKARLR